MIPKIRPPPPSIEATVTIESQKRKVLPGIEPGLPEDTDDESESGVITATYKVISGGKCEVLDGDDLHYKTNLIMATLRFGADIYHD